jgi:general secretion pathway protein L
MEWDYVVASDGGSVQYSGRCAPSLLPKLDSCIAVLDTQRVSWHRFGVPKAPSGRLREALAGVLEESVLSDVQALHLALQPEAVGGQQAWLAATDRTTLIAHLATLEGLGLSVDRIVPIATPSEQPKLHFFVPDAHTIDGSDKAVRLQWSHPQGVVELSLGSGLARRLIGEEERAAAEATATPQAAADAEQWLGRPVRVLTSEARAVAVSRGAWDLRQFDLVRRHRGVRVWRDAWRRWKGPAWRPVRMGLLAFAAVQLIGLNAWAWQLRETVNARKDGLVTIVSNSFPRANPQDIKRDPMAVMLREAQALRAAAGQPANTDFETLLRATAFAWPDGKGPANTLAFEPGRLTIATTGWSDAQIDQLRAPLRPLGFVVEAEAGRLVVSAPRSVGRP